MGVQATVGGSCPGLFRSAACFALFAALTAMPAAVVAAAAHAGTLLVLLSSCTAALLLSAQAKNTACAKLLLLVQRLPLLQMLLAARHDLRAVRQPCGDPHRLHPLTCSASSSPRQPPPL